MPSPDPAVLITICYFGIGWLLSIMLREFMRSKGDRDTCWVELICLVLPPLALSVILIGFAHGFIKRLMQ